MTQFSEIFYTSLISTLSGVFLAILGLLYKSKCENIDLCCGMIKIQRNVNIEMAEDMRDMQPRPSRENSFNNLRNQSRPTLDRNPQERPPNNSRPSLPADVP